MNIEGYGLSKWSEQLNHFSYVDDTIIFSSADRSSLQLIMHTLKMYKQQSGQLINEKKSSLYLLSDWPFYEEEDSFQRAHQEFQNKLQMLKDKLLSISPPKCVIDDTHKNFAKFLRDSKEQGRATY
ncbi:hypothetical protein H5410_021876 [Solanum commersonii]|uniref:Reverse transcriptase domain-containing protein n=1 Tax=Solanum commersonii TaxID=4109 RepID=A0A9J5ZCA6_SOLCO|nr:hypothetical protein H5410_021876 [Solanum commersonii]